MANVGGAWFTGHKIGEGSFGEVYIAVDKNGKEYAIKRELIGIPTAQLMHEVKILNLLQEFDFVPKVHWYGEVPPFNACVMDLLGPNLKHLRVTFGKLPVNFVSDIAVQMVNIMEGIHQKSIVYRDVKPENFLLQLDFEIPKIPGKDCYESDSDSTSAYRARANAKILYKKKPLVYIVDFGLATYYRNPDTGKHVSGKQYLRHKTGTARYASINIHKGKVASRRDDMEALGYVFIDLLKGHLPWSGLTADNAEQGWKKMREKKEMPLEELCEDLPRGFMTYLEYAQSLRFQDAPNYAYLRQILMETAGIGHEAEIITISDQPYFIDPTYDQSPPSHPPKVNPPMEITFPHGNKNNFEDKRAKIPSTPLFKPPKKSSWPSKKHVDIPIPGSNSRRSSLQQFERNFKPFDKFVPDSPSDSHIFKNSDSNYLKNQQHNNYDYHHKMKDSRLNRTITEPEGWNDKKLSAREDPEAWRAGISWDTPNSSEMDSIPDTPVYENSFWNDVDVDGDYVDARPAYMEFIGGNAAKIEWDGNPKGLYLKDNGRKFPNIPQTHPLIQKKSKEWQSFTRRPSVPSPLSIVIPQRVNNNSSDEKSPISQNSYQINSLNNDVTYHKNSKINSNYGNNFSCNDIVNSPPKSTSEYDDALKDIQPDTLDDQDNGAGIDENFFLEHRRSNPNFRGNFQLSANLLKRSVPNLRDVSRHQSIPQSSSNIKNPAAQVHERENLAPIGGLKNFGPDPKYSTQSIQSMQYSPQDVRFSFPDVGKYNSQDGDNSNPFGNNRYRKNRDRGNTISYHTLPSQDARYLPTPPVAPARQSSKFPRGRSNTFSSPSTENNPKFTQQPRGVVNGPANSNSAQNPPHAIKNRDRSNSFSFSRGSGNGNGNGKDQPFKSPIEHQSQPLQQWSARDQTQNGQNRQQAMKFNKSQQPLQSEITDTSIVQDVHVDNAAVDNSSPIDSTISKSATQSHHVSFGEIVQITVAHENDKFSTARRQSFFGSRLSGQEKAYKGRRFTMTSEKERKKAWA
ncbi:hypothetical protein G9A89_010435 [Geosiphon pyriformis]|nr:hypothetical protein G9A89_010435 [Geosiphon pyriformis]